MSFLQPWMLFALPLIALPVIIHLINQRRYRTIKWAAMMFLLTANRMSRGYARIRQWLILAARTLAIAGLLFAVSRPLASGWMRLAGGSVDTTIVIMDRSPSMRETGANGGASKLEMGRDQIVDSLKLLGSNRWLLIDGRDGDPVEVESPDALASLVSAEGVGASSDLPAMLQTAYEYVRDQRPSRTDVWICSDVRRHDWAPGSGRWQAVRDAFLALPQPVRFHLLAFPDVATANRSVRITDVRRAETSSGAELRLALRVEQAGGSDGKSTGPVQIEVDGARSEIPVEISGTTGEVKNHAIPLDGRTQGWGKVSIPADANAADNEFYFVYQKPAARKTLVVAEDPEAVRPLAIAAAVSPEPSTESAVETIGPDQIAGVAWEEISLVLWQAELPQGEAADRMRSFLSRSGKAIFFPPASPAGGEFAGLRWGNWRATELERPVTGWTRDQDLLAGTRGGSALPVGDLEIARHCELVGEQASLATLAGGAPLLCKPAVFADDAAADAMAAASNAYFCATTASPTDSSLARGGVVL
nr:BatA domain-containing protein [Planctomycetota bacterium]